MITASNSLDLSQALLSLVISIEQHLLQSIRHIVNEELQAATANNQAENLLSRKEAANVLKVSVQTIDNWTRSGKLIAHKIPGSRRVYYKESEILGNLQSLQKYQRPIFFMQKAA